ncbi:TolC family outer membrane protein [Pelagibacterium xiamenense]|uniref:TolC family outer membrane protein n=1 Tax=Pelagibacterium xiamenense TaxID=2901140 RepID=UPI001E4EF5A1|nr:TolC family outer membrane protein [Pelagibacterium xiamenense]MCD7061068.1 TolC family outer membrane protein [Pelagibacterium xiamenense]
MSIFHVFRVSAAALLVSATSLAVKAESLPEALAYAYSNNPEIASAFLSVRSARQAIRSAEGSLLPTVGASGSYQASWTDTPQIPGENFNDTVSLGLSYNQTLFDNGASQLGIQVAEADYDAATHAATNTEQNVLLNVVTAYYNVISNQRIVGIRQENLSFVRAQLQAARDRLELGEGTRLEVAQAESAVAQASANYQAAVNNLRTSEATYERYVGHAPSNLSGGMGVSHLLPSSMDAALSIATSGHPGLLASQAQIRSAQLEAQQTRAGFGPNVSVQGQAGLNGFTSGSTASSASVTLSLSIPIYTPTRDPSIQLANIGRMQSELDAFVTRDQIVEAVRQAWAGMQTAGAQIESATAAVAASRLAVQAVVDQSEVGQATTLDVLDAQSDLLIAEETLVSAQAQRNIATFSLISAMGKLTAADLQLAVQPRDAEGAPITPSAAPTDSWSGLR